MTNKTWGGRFKKPLDPRVNAFNASLSFDKALLTQDIKGSQIHVQQLAKQQLISQQESEELLNALVAVQQECLQGLLSFDETCEDIHMFVEQQVIAKAGNVGKKLHTGRSRNDQVALDLRLYAKDKYEEIKTQLDALIACLSDLSQQHQEHQMPGYTHLQQAQPISLGLFFNAYESMFLRDLSRLNDWQQRMNYSPLGACALAGSTLPLDREWSAQALGFLGPITNTLDAVSDRDFVIELCSTASLIMMHLSRLSEDLIIFATQEFGFVILDDAFATGSSLMPNKKNPDVAELVRGKSGRVYGHLMGVLTMMKGLPLAYNKDMQEDKEALFDTVNTLLNCLHIMTPFLYSLQFNTKLMQEKVHANHLDATYWVDKLVQSGIPFRDAHHQIGALVAKAIEQNCSLSELKYEEYDDESKK